MCPVAQDYIGLEGILYCCFSDFLGSPDELEPFFCCSVSLAKMVARGGKQ